MNNRVLLYWFYRLNFSNRSICIMFNSRELLFLDSITILPALLFIYYLFIFYSMTAAWVADAGVLPTILSGALEESLKDLKWYSFMLWFTSNREASCKLTIICVYIGAAHPFALQPSSPMKALCLTS